MVSSSCSTSGKGPVTLVMIYVLIWNERVVMLITKKLHFCLRGRRGSNYMIVGFITTYAISPYHH